MATTLPWLPDIRDSDKPRYLAIVEAVAADIAAGRLVPGDRLPPQRALAEALTLDFTTVARGYAEAQRRGLIDCRIGSGTFVKAPPAGHQPAPLPPGPPLPAPVAASRRPADLSMNLPPDVEDAELIARMRRGLAEVSENLIDLLRYQEFGGAAEDRQAGADWLSRNRLTSSPDRLLVCPGAHSALLAVLSALVKPGEAICAEELVYPGLRSIAAQQGIDLIGLPMDADGIRPDAFADACRARKPKALYCNPTLHNPTTITTPQSRRLELIDIARRFDVTIIEDDAYGALPVNGPPPIAALAPERTYHIAGLGKTLGAGLRIAYLVAPETVQTWRPAALLRAATVMASPLTAALATRWIADGVADAVLTAVRAESARRQTLARKLLPQTDNQTKPEAFHLWLPLPPGWSRSVFAAALRDSGIGIVVSDAFALNAPPEAARICLGGRDGPTVAAALERIAHALSGGPALSAAFL
jgi:DNA-binding transcriptional MocR family regulator